MPGFAFWGLFLIFGLILVAYTVWMFWVERSDPSEGPETGEGDE